MKSNRYLSRKINQKACFFGYADYLLIKTNYPTLTPNEVMKPSAVAKFYWLQHFCYHKNLFEIGASLSQYELIQCKLIVTADQAAYW